MCMCFVCDDLQESQSACSLPLYHPDYHAWHLEDRPKNRMSLRKVIEKMNEQTPTNLNKIIRRVIFERTKNPPTPSVCEPVEQKEN